MDIETGLHFWSFALKTPGHHNLTVSGDATHVLPNERQKKNELLLHFLGDHREESSHMLEKEQSFRVFMKSLEIVHALGHTAVKCFSC